VVDQLRRKILNMGFYHWTIAVAQVTVNVQLIFFLYNSRSVEKRPGGPLCNGIQTIVLRQKPASPRVKTWPRWNLREPAAAAATLGNHFAPPPNCRARRQRERVRAREGESGQDASWLSERRPSCGLNALHQGGGDRARPSQKPGRFFVKKCLFYVCLIKKVEFRKGVDHKTNNKLSGMQMSSLYLGRLSL
jgi:hypothetical protein